jgi:hypothetical protein
MSDEHLQTMATHCSRKKNPTMPSFFGSTLPAETPGKPSKPDLAMITPLPPPDEEEAEEAWDLTRIFSVDDIQDCPIKCSSEACSLPAACVWISNRAPTAKWYSCLDCQAKDFGGWPSPDELPVPHLAKEHVDFLAQKCSRNKGVEMPTFPAASPRTGPGGTGKSANGTSHSLVTPLPGGYTQDDEDDGEEGGGGSAPPRKPPAQAPQQQPSKQALAMHQKWQEAAVAMGGKDARIVVSKPKAKELIFAMLEDAYRPMNITDIHKVRGLGECRAWCVCVMHLSHISTLYYSQN